jgi:hypothetical protein
MNPTYRYTKHQVARGTRADAERNGAFYLFKNCTLLRLTYQIRLLAYTAASRCGKLIIQIPRQCAIDPNLEEFQKEHSKIVRIEKV